MPRRLPTLLALLALLAGACGDSGDGTTTTDAGDDTTTTTVAGDTTTTAGDTTTTTAGAIGGGDTTTTAAGGDDGGTAGGADDVNALLEEFQSTALRATYLFNDGEAVQELTISQDPTVDPPLSALISPDDGTHVIFVGGAMTICDLDQEECFGVPEQPGVDSSLLAGAFLTPFLSSFLSLSVSDATPGLDVTTETAEIAGRSGICYLLSPDIGLGADFEEIRQCVDDETGAILLFETREEGGEFERLMELIELGDPQASDFEPPFPVTPIPGS